MRPLLLKELREHRWVLLALYLLFGLSLLGLMRNADDSGSVLAAFQQLVSTVGVILSLALANRLVVREYSGRTQLFLETLPVSRAQVITVKWLVGLALLAIPMLVGFAVTVYAGADQVVITRRFAALIAVRGGTFLAFFYALAFAIGLTGRYRYVLWGVLIIGALVADTYAQLPIEHWSPIRLVSPSMVFERMQLPLLDLLITWALTALLIGATFTLALASEGALVVMLSRRMTPREAIIVVVSAMAVITLIAQMDARVAKPPFSITDAVANDNPDSLVTIARSKQVKDDDSRQLSDLISADLSELKDYLGMQELPVVFVLPDASIDSDLFLRATLPQSDGVVVRGALGTKQFDSTDFRAFSLWQAMSWHTRDRAQQEDRRWLLDGFAQWWAVRESPAAQKRLLQRAAAANAIFESAHTTRSASTAGLSRWLQVREQLGDCLSDAMAWQAVQLLSQDLGADRFQTLIRSVLGAQWPEDARALLFEPSIDSALKEVDAPTLTDLGERLHASLRDTSASDSSSAEANTVAKWSVSFDAKLMRGKTFEVHYALNAVHAPPLFAVRYKELGPWEGELQRAQMARVDANRSGVLPRSFLSGTALFTAVEVRDADLQCTVRLGASRWEVP